MREDIGGLQFSLQQNQNVANGHTLGGGLTLFAPVKMQTAFSIDFLMCHPGYS
jgi:hypothetical protein